MRINLTILVLLSVLTISLTSCRGAAGREGVEYIEKKGGSLMKKLFKEEPKTSPIQKYKIKRGFKGFKEQKQPQPVNVPCNRCQQRGFIYIVDYYGNVLIDIYGNPQIMQCPNCGGSGVVTKYQ